MGTPENSCLDRMFVGRMLKGADVDASLVVQLGLGFRV